jgi:hypothetical protein
MTLMVIINSTGIKIIVIQNIREIFFVRIHFMNPVFSSVSRTTHKIIISGSLLLDYVV